MLLQVWSAKLITALLQSRGHNFHFLDARKVITVKITEVGDGREIQWETSQANLAAQMAAAPPGCHVVATGAWCVSPTRPHQKVVRRSLHELVSYIPEPPSVSDTGSELRVGKHNNENLLGRCRRP